MTGRLSERQIADLAILCGSIEIEGTNYIIEKQPRGWCDGCAFHSQFLETGHCPSIALKICCTGGNIFKELRTK